MQWFGFGKKRENLLYYPCKEANSQVGCEFFTDNKDIFDGES